MTIGRYLNKYHPDFRRWGILATYYGILYRITRCAKWGDKSVEYLDKRWDAMMEITEQLT
jgi:hypothetical protein